MQLREVNRNWEHNFLCVPNATVFFCHKNFTVFNFKRRIKDRLLYEMESSEDRFCVEFDLELAMWPKCYYYYYYYHSDTFASPFFHWKNLTFLFAWADMKYLTKCVYYLTWESLDAYYDSLIDSPEPKTSGWFSGSKDTNVQEFVSEMDINWA